MFKRFFAFLLGFLVRVILTPVRGAQSNSLFDLDGAFDRLSMISADAFERLQKVLFAVVIVTSLTILAVGVLVVRIFQVSAGVGVPVFGMQVDGAIIFGLVLAVLAFGFGVYLLRDLEMPSVEEKIRRARETLQHAAPPPPPPSSSPLEDALAMAIRHFVETRERNQTAGPTKEADAVPPQNGSENGWKHDKMGQA